MSKQKEDFDKYLTTGEVASLFRVDPKTVTRWAKQGRLDAVRTMGGHRRYSRAQVDAALSVLDKVKTKTTAEED